MDRGARDALPLRGSRATAPPKRVGTNQPCAASPHRAIGLVRFQDNRRRAPAGRRSYNACWGEFPNRRTRFGVLPKFISRRDDVSAFPTRDSRSIQAAYSNLTRTTCEVHHDYSAKTFTALAAAATLGLAAFATAQPTQAHSHHHHHHRHVGVIVAPVGPSTLAPRPMAATGSVSASGTVGAGMCVAYVSAFRNHKQRQKTKRPLRLRGPIFRHAARGITLRMNSVFAAVPPQALPKFNPRKQPLEPFPNGLFTGHSRKKLEPRAHDKCCR